MFRNLRSPGPAPTPVTSDSLAVPPLDRSVPDRLETATFGVG